MSFWLHTMYSDTDECKINNGGCDSENGDCVNSKGSYYCTCNSGYQLASDKHSCEGIILA